MQALSLGTGYDEYTEENSGGHRYLHAKMPEGLTLYGVILFMMGLAMVASAMSALRPSIGGLSLHPCQVPLLVMIPLLMVTRLSHFPSLPLFFFATFAAIYCSAALFGTSPVVLSASSPLQESTKLLASVLMTITVALAVQSRRDYIAAGIGLTIAIGFIGVVSLLRGFGDEAENLRDQLDTGNKNAYSLFALPALLIAGQIVLNQPVRTFTKVILVCCIIGSTIGIFNSANRSGYVGAVVIAVMLLWDRKGWGLLVVGVIGLSVFFFLKGVVGTETFDRRITQTQEGLQSDELRKELFIQSMDVAFTNPLLGVSPEFLPFELGRRTYPWPVVAPHNVVAQIAGGSGLFSLMAFLLIGVSLWRWVPPRQGNRPLTKEFKEARRIVRLMVALYIFRGQFTHEILYNPGFAMGLGIAIGYAMIAADASRPVLDEYGHEVEVDAENELDYENVEYVTAV